MDELFAIQRSIGEVVGVIGLLNEKMPTTYTADSIQDPIIEEVKEVVAKPEGEGGEEDPGNEEAAAEG